MNKQKEQDTLTHLDGIGKVFANALYQSNIHTFAKLAAFTPEQLSQTIEDETGLKVSADRIAAKNWIGQAQAKLDRHVTHVQATKPIVPRWQQQAGFSFFFDFLVNDDGDKQWRTRYFHEESNDERSESSLDLAQITSYIQSKANVPFVQEVAEVNEAAETAVLEGSETAVSIKQIDAVKMESEAAQPEVVVDVIFEITGEHAATITAKRAPFVLKLNLLNDDAEIEDGIAIESTLEPGVYSYQQRQSFGVPRKIGSFQIQSELIMADPLQLTTSELGPILHVKA